MLRFLAFAAGVAVQAQTEPTFEDSAGLGAPNVGYRGRAAPMLTNPAQGWTIRDIDGNIITTASSNYASMIPRGSANHQHVELIIDTPNNLVINNLGGLGPNNGSFPPRAGIGGVGNQANINQPNFIQFANIATVGGQAVAMRIDNTSVYKPDRVQQNRKYNDFLLQINLHPVLDFHGVDDPYDIINMFPPALRPLFPPLLTQWEHSSKYTNQLNLFYSFFDQASGTPIELEEFCIVFYDFDQDWADGGKAYVRETVMVSDFTTMFYRPGSEEQLEFTFSKQWEDMLPQMPAINGVQLDMPMAHTYFRGCDNNNICNGFLPQYTFTSWPYSEDRRMAVHRPVTRTGPAPTDQTSIAEWPTYLNSEAAGHGNANWGFAPLYTTQESAAVSAMVLKKGIIIRSTTQGTGPAYSPKWYYGGCQGGCSQGTTCNMAQLTTSTNQQAPDWWTGCGIAQGYSETGSGHPATWNCILDCPRTSVANDYGQPTNAQQDPLTPEGDQWYARAVIFMFRNKQNFTVTYRTEIGADVVDLMERDRPDLVNSDLVNENQQWTDPFQGRQGRLFGRNFLVGGFTAPLYQCSDLPTTCLSCCEYAHCYDALHSGTAPNQLPMSCQVPAIMGGLGGTAQASCMPSVIQGGAGVCQMPVAQVTGSCCTPSTPPAPPPPRPFFPNAPIILRPSPSPPPPSPSPPPPSPPPPVPGAQCSDIPASCLTCTEYAHCYAALDAGTAVNALPSTCLTLPMGTALASCMPSTVPGGAGICEMPVMALLAGCATTTTCTACSDPHLALAHGGRADFKGAHNAWYSMLSAKNISFNALFLHDDFKNPYKLVHGSAMKATAWVIRTGITGTIVTIEYNATAQTLSRAMVKTSTSKAGQWVAHGARAFNLENVKVEMKEKKLVGAGVNGRGKAWHGMALVVTTGLWQISIWNKPYPNAAANPGKALLNINIEPLYDADNDVVAPHGLIGQSWDGDGLPTHGLLDDYSEAEVTTSAMGEGAIEGTAVDYQMKHGLATDFKFSRFDAVKAAHRDTTNLKKITRKDVAAAAVGATADVEDEA